MGFSTFSVFLGLSLATSTECFPSRSTRIISLLSLPPNLVFYSDSRTPCAEDRSELSMVLVSFPLPLYPSETHAVIGRLYFYPPGGVLEELIPCRLPFSGL